MTSPLNILKKGLKALRKRVASRKTQLEADLKAGKTISAEEEEWLDGAGNLVDEEHVVQVLDNGSDYERGLERLDMKNRGIVRELISLGGGDKEPPSKKRKRTSFIKYQSRKLTGHGLAGTTGVGSTAENSNVLSQLQVEVPAGKKENATLEQRIEILDWYQANGRNQTKTAKHFIQMYPNLHIKQPLVSAWVKDEKKWREAYAQSGGSQKSAKRARQTQHPEVTEMMDLWVLKALGDGIMLTGEVLRQKWTTFANMVCIPDDERLHLSNGWLASYKARHNLKQMTRHGEAGSAENEVVERERERIQDLIKKKGYTWNNIFNMDETGLFYAYVLWPFPVSSNKYKFPNRLPPDRGLADKKHSGVKGRKVRLTYALTSNASGSEKREPFVIGKAHKPRAFKRKTGADLGFLYRNNAKAWMTTSLYQEWIRAWDNELELKKRNILLFQDNFSGHIVPNDLKRIEVVNFKPNLTAHVQPMDQGIIKSFKAQYRAQYIERAINCYDAGISPSAIYDINQLEAMRLAHNAWHKVDANTIQHCWRKANILPDPPTTSPQAAPSIPISSMLNPLICTDSESENLVTAALDDLALRGVLQASNRMTVEELLNPLDESTSMDKVTDEEIYKAVMDSKAERENAAANDIGDDDVDDNAPIELPPSRHEALQAKIVIEKYVETIDEPYTCKLESILADFARSTRLIETQNKKVSLLTDYFTRK
jgi:hypothetical protein